MELYDMNGDNEDDGPRPYHHPSRSIPNAAYPDDPPYQPGGFGAAGRGGGEQGRVRGSMLQLHGLSVTAQGREHELSSDPAPDEPPPPPYDPTSASSPAYSPIDTPTPASHHHHHALSPFSSQQQQHQTPPHEVSQVSLLQPPPPPVPPPAPPPAAAAGGDGNRHMSSHQNRHRRVTSSHSVDGKLRHGGPNEVRIRRQRWLKIWLAIILVTLVAGVGIFLGVAIGAEKLKLGWG